MGFLKNIFAKKDEPIKSYEDFWNWFQQNEKTFFKVVKDDGDIEQVFFSKLSCKLDELKDGFYYLAGMYSETTVELVFTAEGSIRNIVFVEELVNAAPEIVGWKFTTLKPELDIKDVNINMSGFKFNRENIGFYANVHPWFPDEIDIIATHPDFNEGNKTIITNGIYIFLDNFLGELKFATTIDTLRVVGKESAEGESIPIEKLKDYLVWRQKEFIEKYDGARRSTEKDSYVLFTAKLNSGNELIAVINTDMLSWDAKASHPWVLCVEIEYVGKNSGMPEEVTYQMLEEFENDMLAKLKDADGYLNIGRQTADGIRTIYFACRDFRKPSLVVYGLSKKYASKFKMTYDIYKDKYWRSFNRFTEGAE